MREDLLPIFASVLAVALAIFFIFGSLNFLNLESLPAELLMGSDAPAGSSLPAPSGSATPSFLQSPTPSFTPLSQITPTPTATTPTPGFSPTPSLSSSPTPLPSQSPSPSPSPSSLPTPTFTLLPSPVLSNNPTPSPLPTNPPGVWPSNSFAPNPTATPTQSFPPTPEATVIIPGNNLPGGGGNVLGIIIDSLWSVGKSTAEEFEKNFESQGQTALFVGGELKKALNTPQGSFATKAISTAGVALSAASAMTTILMSPFSLTEVFLIPFRLFSLLLVAFGLKKRELPWGVVYDSVTKQPLDPAYVTLKDEQGKKISSAITDMDGRYGFLPSPGIYQMGVNKTNYVFPSQKLAGNEKDEFYNDLYWGQQVQVKKEGEAIFKNIPLDPVGFDWNEFVKSNKNLVKFYSRLDLALRKISDIFFIFGFIVAIIAYLAAPYLYNSIIMGTYIFLLLLRIAGLKPKPYGIVKYKNTGEPLSFCVIKVFADIDGSSVEISKKIADKYGRYYCLLPKGLYYLTIEKKNNDGSYSLAYSSNFIDVSKSGIIKETFNI